MVSQLPLGLVVTQVFNLQYFNPQLVSCSHLVKSSIWRPMKLQALCLHPDLHCSKAWMGLWKFGRWMVAWMEILQWYWKHQLTNWIHRHRLVSAGLVRKWCLEPPGWILGCSARMNCCGFLVFHLSHTNLKMKHFSIPLCHFSIHVQWVGTTTNTWNDSFGDDVSQRQRSCRPWPWSMNPTSRISSRVKESRVVPFPAGGWEQQNPLFGESVFCGRQRGTIFTAGLDGTIRVWRQQGGWFTWSVAKRHWMFFYFKAFAIAKQTSNASSIVWNAQWWRIRLEQEGIMLLSSIEAHEGGLGVLLWEGKWWKRWQLVSPDWPQMAIRECNYVHS